MAPRGTGGAGAQRIGHVARVYSGRFFRRARLHATPDVIRDSILQTKLHRPAIGDDVVCRPRLHEQMLRGHHTPLTVVSAPAGYGKSVLVSHWAESPDRPCAWVSLSEPDGDPRLFLSYVLAAVRTIFSGACKETGVLLRASEMPPVVVLVRSLANELDALDAPFTLVLDDYHSIPADSQVHELLRQLLQHPPRPLHLVVISRRDPPLPLARLRARGLLTEVRLDDLRFTGPETAALLEKATGLTVTEEALANLQREMEGWVVGLRLAALALGHLENPDTFLEQMRGGIQHARDYLVQEALAVQTPQTREWLLKTAILERFCPELCEHICGAGESEAHERRGEAFVRTIQERNLFVIALDADGRWLRYHHLFQELLGNELRRAYGPEDVRVLHSRACDWFEAEGFIEEALTHALAAEDVERAAQIVERQARPMMNRVNYYVLERWLSRLPQDVVQERPQLLWAQAWGHYGQMRLAALPPLMDRIDELMGGAESHALSRDVALFRGLCTMMQGNGARALQYFEQALEEAGHPLQGMSRAVSELLFGAAGQMEGQRKRVTRALKGWLDDSSQLDPLRETNLAQTLVFMAYVAADPPGIEAYLTRGRSAARSGALVGMAPWNDHLDGLFHLQWGELATALSLLEAAGQRRYVHHVRGALDGFCARVLAYQAHGQPEKANATLKSLGEFIGDRRTSFGGLSESCAVRLALMDGRLEPAARWLERAEPPSSEVMLFWFEVPCVTWCRALIAEGSATSLREAEKRLREHTEVNERQHNTCQLIPLLGLKALLCKKVGETEAALSALERAVSLARPGGFLFSFLELGSPMADLLRRLHEDDTNKAFVQRILSAMGVHDASTPVASERASQSLVDPLTNRELEILELLARRLRDKEIAEKLCVSPETVNTHLKHVYQKLEVRGRRQAVAKGTELGLLKTS